MPAAEAAVAAVTVVLAVVIQPGSDRTGALVVSGIIRNYPELSGIIRNYHLSQTAEWNKVQVLRLIAVAEELMSLLHSE